VKLVASLFCVAALSLVGCVDDTTNAGGQGEGLDPAKTTANFGPIDNGSGLHDAVYNINLSGLALREIALAEDICSGCTIQQAFLPERNGTIDEVRVIGVGENVVCRIYLGDGEVVMDECGITGAPN
jgi:hypothetical protein